MSLIFTIIIFLSGIYIVSGNEEKSQTRFLCILLLVNSSLLLTSQPRITSHLFFILCLAYSLVRKKQFKFDNIPFKAAWIIYIICFIVIATNGSSSATWGQMLFKMVKTFLSTYFVLLIGYFSYSTFQVNKRILYVITTVLLYGFLTLLLRDDPLRAFMPIEFDYDYMFGSRIRMASTWSHPISYGYVCSVLYIVLMGLDLRDRIYKITKILLLISVFLAGSRTVVIVFFIMMMMNSILNGNNATKRNLFAVIIGIILLSCFVPAIQNIIFGSFDLFRGGTRISGSSIDMRQGQWDACFLLFLEHPLFGGGFDYIQEVLGYGNNVDASYWLEFGDLYGFESYIFVLLIERGLFGIIGEIFILLSIARWIHSNRRNSKDNYAKAMTILSGFVIFSMMTGTLDAWVIAMYFIGIYMGSINSKKTELYAISNNNSCL